jgi:hypothetical protein
MSFRSSLSQEEQDNLITGALLKRVEALLRGRRQCEAMSLVMAEKGVSLVDAISPVNKIYRRIDPSFMPGARR